MSQNALTWSLKMTLKHYFNACSTVVLSEHIGEATLSWNGKESQKQNILSWKGFIRITEFNDAGLVQISQQSHTESVVQTLLDLWQLWERHHSLGELFQCLTPSREEPFPAVSAWEEQELFVPWISNEKMVAPVWGSDKIELATVARISLVLQARPSSS